MSDARAKFVLVGHDCPLGEYPSIVVPVGKLEGQLVVLYSSPDAPKPVPVSNRSAYVQHSAETTRKLAQFDHKRHGLFAFGEQSVMIYRVGQEGEFFARLLRSSESSALEPFYRFSLARETRQPDLIREAFDECVRQLRSDSPQFAEQWIRENGASRMKVVVGDEAASNLAFFFAGLAFGAIVAILFAPRSGEETREYIVQMASEGKDYVASKGRELRRQAEELVEKGKDVVTQQREQLAAAFDAGKQAYHDEKSKR